jgi:hypothetical protein
MRHADWKGPMKERAVFTLAWPFYRYEAGRWCYQTDAMGRTLAEWWEPTNRAATDAD